MAENTNIPLGTFEFDSTRLEQNIDALQKKMFQLRTETQALTEQNNALRKEYNEIEKAKALLVRAGQQESQQYKDLTAAQAGLKTQMQGIFQEQKNIQIQSSALNKEYNQTVKVYQSMTSEAGEFLGLQESLNRALEQEIVTKQDAILANRQLVALSAQLNPALAEEAEMLAKVNAQIDKNTDFIKNNSSATEQQRMNIGNYKNDITDAANELNIFNGGLLGFAERSQAAGGSGKLFGSALSAITTGVGQLTKATLAFIATPIGAIIAALAAVFLVVKTAMDRSTEATEKITKIFSVFTGIIDFVLKALEPLGTFIIDGLVAGFELLAEAASAAMDLLADGLEFLGFDDAAAGVREFKDEMAEATKAAMDLAAAEAQLEKEQRKARLTQLQYQKQAEEFRQIRDDENRTIAERIKANEELGAVLQKQLTEELKIAQLALKVANMRLEQEGQTKENLDAQATALEQIADIEERITGQQSEQLQNRVALQKEYQERIKAQQEAAIQRQKEALDLFIAEQGVRAKSLQEQLEIEREISRQSIAILDAELKAKKISRTKYNTEVLNINNELLKRQAEVTADYAQQELNDFIRDNKTKIEQGKLLSEESIAQEKLRLDTIEQLSIDALNFRLSEQLITQQEYDNALLAQLEATEVKKQEIQKRYDDQRKAEQQLQRSLEFEAELLTLEEEGLQRFEREQLIADEQYALSKEKLDEQLANNLISQENYNLALKNLNVQKQQADKQIEDAISQYKLQVASQTFSNLVTIAGKETAAGKAFSIAQTTIDTFQAAQSAFSGMVQAIPGPVGIALGASAAAAAVVSGMANVKKIIGVKEPKVSTSVGGYATGGLISDGFRIRRSNGDNVLITAKRGEAVLTQGQQAIIGHGALAAAGVPGFATGGIVPSSSRQIIQNDIVNQIGNSEITDIMREAVRTGAMEGSYNGTYRGSETGITNLSDNRTIQNQAAF